MTGKLMGRDVKRRMFTKRQEEQIEVALSETDLTWYSAEKNEHGWRTFKAGTDADKGAEYPAVRASHWLRRTLHKHALHAIDRYILREKGAK